MQYRIFHEVEYFSNFIFNYSIMVLGVLQTRLVTAASRGDVAAVRVLIEETGLDPLTRSEHGYSLLHFAAQRGHLALTEYLLSLRNDTGYPVFTGRELVVNLANLVSATPLYVAMNSTSNSPALEAVIQLLRRHDEYILSLQRVTLGELVQDHAIRSQMLTYIEWYSEFYPTDEDERPLFEVILLSGRDERGNRYQGEFIKSIYELDVAVREFKVQTFRAAEHGYFYAVLLSIARNPQILTAVTNLNSTLIISPAVSGYLAVVRLILIIAQRFDEDNGNNEIVSKLLRTEDNYGGNVLACVEEEYSSREIEIEDIPDDQIDANQWQRLSALTEIKQLIIDEIDALDAADDNLCQSPFPAR